MQRRQRLPLLCLGLTVTLCLSHLARANEIPWVSTYNTAIQRGLAERKQVFLFMGREGCGTCVIVKNRLSMDGPFAALMEHYIPWYVTVDDPGEHRQYYANKGSSLNLPLMAIIDPAHPYPERFFRDGLVSTAGLEKILLDYAVESSIEISGLQAVPGHRRTNVSWTAPGSAVAAGIVVVRGEGLEPSDANVTLSYANNTFSLSAKNAANADRFTMLTPAGLAPTAAGLVDPPVGAGTGFLDNGTTYYYRVLLYDAGRILSDGITVSSIPSFDSVTLDNLSAAAGDGSVTLQWQYPSLEPDRSDIAGVLLARSTSATFPSQLPVGPLQAGDPLPDSTSANVAAMVAGPAGTRAATSWTDTDVPNGTTQYYMVYAFTADYTYAAARGTGPGTPLSATPSFANATPTGLTAASEPDRIALTWKAPLSNTLAGIMIVRKAGSTPNPSLTKGATYSSGATLSDSSMVVCKQTAASGQLMNWKDTEVTYGTDYYYAAYAYDDTRNYSLRGTPTAGPVAATMIPHTVALADDAPSAIGNSRISFTWTNPDVPGFAGVVIFRQKDADRTLPVPPPSTTPEDGTAPTTYAGADVTVLTVNSRDDLQPGGETTWTDSSVLNDEFYSYAFYAFSDQHHYSGATTWIPAVDSDRPSFREQTVSSVTEVIRSTSITLNWTNPTPVNLGGILVLGRRYSATFPQITYVPTPGTKPAVGATPADPADPSNNTWLDVILSSNAAAGTHSGLQTNSEYIYRIFAYDTNNRYSDPVDIGPLTTQTCAAANVRAQASGYKGIRVSWQIPESSQPHGLFVLRSTGAKPIHDFADTLAPTKENLETALAGSDIDVAYQAAAPNLPANWQDTGLDDGTTYWYGVYLYDSAAGKTYYGYCDQPGGSSAEATASADLDRDGVDDMWEATSGGRNPNTDSLQTGLPNGLQYLLDNGFQLPPQHIVLYRGWNMIAFPPTEQTRSSRQTAGDLLGNAIVGAAWAWDAKDQVYADMTNEPVLAGIGYWLYAPRVAAVDLGSPLAEGGSSRDAAENNTRERDLVFIPADGSIPIAQGWNMVALPDWISASPGTTVQEVWGEAAQQREVKDPLTGEVLETRPLIWHWSGSRQDYADAANKDVRPDTAYWFYAPEQGFLVPETQDTEGTLRFEEAPAETEPGTEDRTGLR